MNNKIYDLIIIGAGPVGLYSSFLSGYMKLDSLCIEEDSQVGGQPKKLYPHKYIYDFPGYPKITGSDLIDRLLEQVEGFSEFSKLITNTKIIKIIKKEEYFELIDSNDIVYKSKFILLTNGLGRHKYREINSDIVHDTIKVDYCLNPNKKEYKDKEVVVLGGGDAAVDLAIQIKDNFDPKKVCLVHRSDELSTKTKSIKEICLKGIEVLLEKKINRICDKQNIYFEDDTTISFDKLVVQFGLDFNTYTINGLEELNKINNKIVVDQNFETSIKNIYAAGSCVYSESRINMIITGISESTIALNRIKFLLPNTKKVIW